MQEGHSSPEDGHVHVLNAALSEMGLKREARHTEHAQEVDLFRGAGPRPTRPDPTRKYEGSDN